MARVGIANAGEIAPVVESRGERYGSTRWRLGAAAGSARLGCSEYEVGPGRSAFPRHFHHANEEAVYVLAGRGTIRVGDDAIPVGPGDWIALPTGPDHAHQIVNDGPDPLRYLAVSTMDPVDITEYPDSGKVGLFAGAAPGGDAAKRKLGGFYRKADAVGYWDGEDG